MTETGTRISPAVRTLIEELAALVNTALERVEMVQTWDGTVPQKLRILTAIRESQEDLKAFLVKLAKA